MTTIPAAANPPPTPPAEMLPFRYDAQTVDGRTFRGILEAASVQDAHNRLSALNLRILSLDAAPPTQRPPRKPLGRDDFLLFNQQLAYLTAAGLPVERGLRLVATDLRSGRLSNAANAVAHDLESGKTLREAFENHARDFPPLYARLVDAGVSAGNLPSMLFNLGRHLELVARLRHSLWQVLSYPLMVLVAAGVVFYFITTLILPQFEAIYGDFKTTLPAITEVFIALGQIYPTVFLTLLACIAGVVLLVFALYSSGRGGILTDAIFIRIPLIGRVIHASLLARWIDALRLAIEAGLDLPRAIALAADSAASPRLTRESAELTSIITSGRALSVFQGRMLPNTIPASLELGSATGNLPATLATLSSLYEQQAEYRLRILPTLLTPLLLLFTASVIGLGIAALFAPLVKLIQSVSGGI